MEQTPLSDLICPHVDSHPFPFPRVSLAKTLRIMIHSSTPIPLDFASHALQLLQKVQRGISPVELVYTAHEHWPFQPGHTVHTRPSLHISVLDSSFNPPTLAHLALANSPPPLSHQRSAAASAPAESYDARMLLLSVRNAEKVLRPGDATFVQRLEMMRLFSQDMCPSTGASGESTQTSNNVAVAIIDEPTFVGKSTVLLRFLQKRLATVVVKSSESPNSTSNKRDASYALPSPKLTFLLGFDTFVRLFSTRYYPSGQVMVHMLRTFLSADREDCRIGCAYRQSASTDKTFQDTALEVAHEFIISDRIAYIDIGTEEQTYSSSEVRAKVAAKDEKWKQLVTNVIANYILSRGIYSGNSE